MRRSVLWLASTVTIVVLLFGYHTSTNKTSSAATPSVSTAGSGSAAESPSSSSASAGSRTYTGSVAQTEWGPVQVKITVTDGKVTAIDLLRQPDGNHRDVEINAYAVPELVQETLKAQSADVDMVSGATVTSRGYVESLQAALDEAGI